MFQKLDLFQSSGEGRETPTLLGPLERTDLSVYWMKLVWSMVNLSELLDSWITVH
jgi:hypothetical protein